MAKTNTKTTNAPETAGEAPATLPNNVTPLVQTSKIDLAREHFHRINAEGYKPAEGSTPRKDFINVCVNELKMTEPGASTYWQNLRNEGQGKGLYAHGPAPTGNPRGRRPDVGGKIKKAAAKVKRIQDRIKKEQGDLEKAQSELIELSTGEPVAQ